MRTQNRGKLLARLLHKIWFVQLPMVKLFSSFSTNFYSAKILHGRRMLTATALLQIECTNKTIVFFTTVKNVQHTAATLEIKKKTILKQEKTSKIYKKQHRKTQRS